MSERYAELREAIQTVEQWALGDRLDAAGALAYKRAWERYRILSDPVSVAALLAERDALVEALRTIAAYDGRLDASEAARSWRTAADALSKTGAGM